MSTKRERVLEKTLGHCGYCGVSLNGKRWHIDHIEPLHRGRKDIGGSSAESNLMASCSRCNIWKKTYSVDQFRDEIARQHERLLRDVAGYRLAYDLGLINVSSEPIEFWFEAKPRTDLT